MQKRQTTKAKLDRERKLQERRELKRAKKAAAAAQRAGGEGGEAHPEAALGFADAPTGPDAPDAETPLVAAQRQLLGSSPAGSSSDATESSRPTA